MRAQAAECCFPVAAMKLHMLVEFMLLPLSCVLTAVKLKMFDKYICYVSKCRKNAHLSLRDPTKPCSGCGLQTEKYATDTSK